MGGRFLLQCVLGVAAVTMLPVPHSHADMKARFTATTDYLQRGLQQNTDGLAYQGMLEYDVDNGLFAGIWASNVSFGSFDDRNFELDYFAGYSRTIRPGLAFDATFIHYTFPGHTKPRDYDWTEVMVSAYLGDRWLLSAGVADNWLARNETTTFVEGGYRYPLPLSLTVDLTLGYQSLKDPFPDYAYFELGISRRVGAVDVRVGYAVTDHDARDWFGSWADNRWLASISFEI
jgi:uncharacterized protein (TIGR02001 family)